MLLKVTFSEEELAVVDKLRGQTARSTWIRQLVRDAGAAGRVLSEVEPGAGVELPSSVPGGREVREDDELARRRRIAATHKPGCRCLNCEATG